MARLGRCVNFGNCPLADSREPIEVPESEDFVCPAPCERPLQEVEPERASSLLPRVAVAAALLALVGAGLWLVLVDSGGPPPPALPTPDVASASPAPPPLTPAPCQPAPLSPDTVAAVRRHVDEGMRHAAGHRHKDAQQQFERAQSLAPQWPGLSNQVAAARLGLKDAAGARTAIEAELRLLECLRTLDDTFLATLEPALGSSSDPGDTGIQRIRRQLDEVEAHTRYNLACVHATSDQVEPALAELRLAVTRGFRNRQALLDERDLAPVRARPAFDELLAALK